tara:strand:+ start:4289 stop:4660 length:372 start_codon:yes stop_codon:yes gene_type:complete
MNDKEIKNIIDKIDIDVLGDLMQDKAESIQYSDYNIILFNIDQNDLENENFENMEELIGVEYGDWNLLGAFISQDEINRIKEYFDEDLNRLMEDEDNGVDDYSQIYMSFLYCNKVYVWSGMEF